MKITDNLGIGYRDVLDGVLRELQNRYNISRHNARFLFANALPRSCVYDELIGVCDMLMDKENYDDEEEDDADVTL